MHRFVFQLVGLLASLAFASPALAAPKVVTDIAPVQSLVAMVMGDLGTPGLLLPKGADPHDFQLRPSQARALAAADLVVWVGTAMSPWLNRAYRGIGAKAAMLTLLDAPQTKLRNFDSTEKRDPQITKTDTGAAPPPPQAVKHTSGQSGEEHDDTGDGSGIDPHVWLDPQNAANWLPLIAAELSRLDPQNAAAYRANATAGQATIAATEADITARLAPVVGKPFVTFHQAYGYFTAHFGLISTGSVRVGDAAAPGAAHLSALRRDLRQGSTVCLFPEANHNPAQASQMIEGTATRLGGALDPAGVTLQPGPALYGALLEALTDTLLGCLASP